MKVRPTFLALAFAAVAGNASAIPQLTWFTSSAPSVKPVNVLIRIYAQPLGGAPLYSELHCDVPVLRGPHGLKLDYAVLIGSIDPVGNPLNLPFDKSYYVSETFCTSPSACGEPPSPQACLSDPERSPRTRWYSVPYAFRAADADFADQAGLANDLECAGCVATADLADSSVTTAKILDLTVGTGDIANLSVTNGKIATSAVNSVKIQDGTVSSADLASSSVTAIKIAASAVDTNKILNSTIIAADLATSSVDTNKILNSTIIAADLATSAVDSTKILDGTIANADLATGAVNSVKILDASIAGVDVNSAEVQRRVSGVCAVGSTIEAINPDGTVVCQPHSVRAAENLRIVRGSFDGAGTRLEGAGFTSARLGVGQFQLTFLTPFTGNGTMDFTPVCPGGCDVLDLVVNAATATLTLSVDPTTVHFTASGPQ